MGTMKNRKGKKWGEKGKEEIPKKVGKSGGVETGSPRTARLLPKKPQGNEEGGEWKKERTGTRGRRGRVRTKHADRSWMGQREGRFHSYSKIWDLFVCFVFVFVCACGMWKFPGRGWNLHHSRDPNLCSDKAGSLTCCATR